MPRIIPTNFNVRMTSTCKFYFLSNQIFVMFIFIITCNILMFNKYLTGLWIYYAKLH
jgi:hypothetical protein